MKRISSIFLLTFLSAAVARAEEPIVEKLEHGEVNWSKKTIIATGSGAPNLKLPNVAAVRLNAERAAKLDAYRNVLEALKGVRISSNQPAGAALENNEIRTQVQGIIQGCKVVDTRYYSDGGVDVVVRCPLDGGIATTLSTVKSVKPLNTTGEAKYSGLIIDAVGLKAHPALSPKVLGDADKVIYSTEVVQPSALRQQGAASFVRSLEEAQQDPRVGKNPLVVKAVGLGAEASEVRISAEDAAKLDNINLTFLAEARVVIVTDGP